MKKILSQGIFKNHRERLATLSLVLVFLLMWEGLAQAGLASPIIFPAPSKIIVSFITGLINGEFTHDSVLSVSRILSGFLVGGGAGLLLGLVLGWSRRIRRVLDPIVAALHPIPKLALLPMALIIFGLGETSRTVMVSISAFFPMVISTMAGVMQINPTYYEVVENYGASKLDIFRKVVLPGSLPYVMSGARLSLKSALTMTIGVEMIYGTNGLGSVLWLAWETMRMTDLYSAILIVSIMGISITWVLELFKRFFIPWLHENRPA